MKTLLLILFMLLNSIQGSAQNTCSSPLYFAPDTGMVNYLNIDYPNSDLNIDYGCFTSIPDTSVTWVFFQICTSGNLNLALTPVNSAADIDFVVYGPVTTPFTCDYTQNEVVACSFLSSTTIETFNVNNCIQGETYLIAISNYYNVFDQYRFERIGGTATICPMAYLSINQPPINEIKVYPNPSEDVILIEHLPENVLWRYNVFGVDGRVVKKGVLTNSYLNISDLKKGIYTIMFVDQNKNTFLSKVLKI